MCEFQRVQIVNVLNVLSFLRKGRAGAAETVLGAQWRPALGSSITKLFLEEDVGLLTLICNLKKKKLTKENCQLLLDLGLILKWANLSVDSVRNRYLEK